MEHEDIREGGKDVHNGAFDIGRRTATDENNRDGISFTGPHKQINFDLDSDRYAVTERALITNPMQTDEHHHQDDEEYNIKIKLAEFLKKKGEAQEVTANDEGLPMPMRLLQKKYDVTELANQDLDDLEFDDSREKNTIKK